MRLEMVEVEENSLVTVIHAQVHHNVWLASIRDWDTPWSTPICQTKLLFSKIPEELVVFLQRFGHRLPQIQRFSVLGLLGHFLFGTANVCFTQASWCGIFRVCSSIASSRAFWPLSRNLRWIWVKTKILDYCGFGKTIFLLMVASMVSEQNQVIPH